MAASFQIIIIIIILFLLLLGGNAVFVPTFWLNSHFGPYFLFLAHLVPILKNVICFGLYC